MGIIMIIRWVGREGEEKETKPANRYQHVDTLEEKVLVLSVIISKEVEERHLSVFA